MGHLSHQPASADVQANRGGSQASRARGFQLRAHAGRDHPCSGPGRIVNRLKQFFLRRDLYHDLDDEIAFHLEERERELVAGGMPASEAHAAAYREFGNVGMLKESAREAWGWRWLEDLSLDLRFGA